MRQNHAFGSRTAGEAPGRKVRTSDCSKCVIMKSLRAAALPASTAQAVCERMRLNLVRRRQILYTEGNEASRLYAIRSGRIKLVKVHPSGRENVTAVLGPGDLFGFEAVFDDAYATGAEALTDAELCVASGDELKRLMAEIPRMSVDFTGYLHGQLCRTRDLHACLGVPGAAARLAGYILHMSSRDESVDCFTAPDDLALRELAGILGLTPETVCRARGELRRRGLIELEDATIQIRNIGSLQRLAGV